MFVFTFELRSAGVPAGKSSGVENVPLVVPTVDAKPAALTEAPAATPEATVAAAPAATAFEEAAIFAFRSGVTERSRAPRVREPEGERERGERESDEECERECEELRDSERLFDGDPLPPPPAPRSTAGSRSSRSRALLIRRVSAAGGGV